MRLHRLQAYTCWCTVTEEVCITPVCHQLVESLTIVCGLLTPGVGLGGPHHGRQRLDTQVRHITWQQRPALTHRPGISHGNSDQRGKSGIRGPVAKALGCRLQPLIRVRLLMATVPTRHVCCLLTACLLHLHGTHIGRCAR